VDFEEVENTNFDSKMAKLGKSKFSYQNLFYTI